MVKKQVDEQAGSDLDPLELKAVEETGVQTNGQWQCLSHGFAEMKSHGLIHPQCLLQTITPA